MSDGSSTTFQSLTVSLCHLDSVQNPVMIQMILVTEMLGLL